MSNELTKTMDFTILKQKDLLMSMDDRQTYLKFTDEERAEALRSDPQAWLLRIVEKGFEMVDSDDQRLRMNNNTYGMGEFGQNIPAQMQALLRQHPNMSAPLRNFFSQHEAMKDIVFTNSDISQRLLAITSEVLDTLSENWVAIETGFKERQEIEDSLGELKPQKETLEEEIKQLTKKRDSILSEMSIGEAKILRLDEDFQIKQHRLEQELMKAKSDVQAQQMLLELTKRDTENEKKYAEYIAETRKKAEAGLETIISKPVPKSKEQPEPKEPKVLEEQKQSKEIMPQQPEPKIQNNKKNNPNLNGDAVTMICPNKSCPNSVPGRWVYKGKAVMTRCGRCGTNVAVVQRGGT
jgi:hypothetical protein